MPRTSKRGYNLASISDAIKSSTCTYLLVSDMDDADKDMDDMGKEDIEDLFAIRKTVTAHRYLVPHYITTSRHTVDTLEDYIQEFSERKFLAFFLIHIVSFWQLIDLLTKAI